MAGSSNSPSGNICTTSLSPKVKSTEKKKRKRPSKKVPTTVLESSSTNFMNLVQKLTGTAGEIAAAKSNPDSSHPANSVTSNSITSGTSSPYSSPSCDYIDPRSSNTFYQQLLRSATMAVSSYDNNDDDSSSHSNYTPAPFPNPNAHHLVAPASLDHFHQSPNSEYYNAGVADDDDFYNSYPSSRAIENEISPFSSWREPMGSHSDYWYQPMDSAMQA